MKVFLVVCTSVVCLALVGCDKESTQATNCDSPEVKTIISKGVSKRLLEEGVKGYSADELASLVSVLNTKPTEHNGDYYKCKGDLSIALPSDLGSKIGAAYSTVEGRKVLREKLETKFGMINGPSAFNSINGLIADGSFGVVPTVPSVEQLKPLVETVTKNAQEIVSAGTNIAFTYEVSQAKDADGKKSTNVKWYIDNYEILDVDVALISLAAVL